MNPLSNARPRPVRKAWQRAAVAVAAVLALAGVFALYQRPDFLVMLADQAWSCF